MGIMQYIRRYKAGGGLTHGLSAALLALLLVVAPVAVVHADDDKPKIAMPEGTCTNDHQFDIKPNGIISSVANDIAGRVADMTSSISSNMFSGAGGVAGIGGSIDNMCKIYIVIYGVLFMFGVVQATIFEFISRLAKVAIVASLAGGASELDSLMQNFFEQGTSDMIMAVSGGELPLDRVDQLVDAIVSPKMIVTLATIATTGFYGPFLFLILIASFQSLAGAILNAVWIYLMSEVVRGILYGVAPIFIACALFQRTRDFYQGWLNQLVNACLQPIFLFTFFAFFIHLIGDVITQIMGVPICLTPMPETGRGAAINTFWWRFTNGGEQYDELWGASTGFPVDIFQIFIFFILAELVSRFSDIIVLVAKSISGAATNMTRLPLMSSWPSPRGGRGDGQEGSGKGKGGDNNERSKPTDNSNHADNASKDASRNHSSSDDTRTPTTTVGKRGAAGGQLLRSKGKKGTNRDGSMLDPDDDAEDDDHKKDDPFESSGGSSHGHNRGASSVHKQTAEKITKRRDIKVPKKEGSDD